MAWYAARAIAPCGELLFFVPFPEAKKAGARFGLCFRGAPELMGTSKTAILSVFLFAQPQRGLGLAGTFNRLGD